MNQELITVISYLHKMVELQDKSSDIIESLLPGQQVAAAKAQEPLARVSILSSRRSGKSWTAISILVSRCLHYKCNTLFVGQTRDSAEEAGWELLKEILYSHKIVFEENKSKLRITFSNGSTITFVGVPDKKQAGRLLGRFYDCVCIDEAGSFEADVLNYLLQVVLEPALTQCDGRIVLIGTPREIFGGIFYEATTNKNSTYDNFVLKTTDNVYLAKKWKRLLKKKEKEDPNFWTKPKNRREYLGEWVREESKYVYKYNDDMLIGSWVPQAPTYVIGVDVGWECAMGFVVGSWNKHSTELIIVESFKKNKMLLGEIANKLEYYMGKYKNISEIVVDSAGGSKVIQEELASRYTIPVTSANKTEKNNWIATMNDEMTNGNIKVIGTNNQDLITEWKELPWKEMSDGTLKESGGFARDLCDAALYMFKHSYPHFEKPRLTLSREEIIELEEEKRSLAMAKRLRRRRR